MSTNRDIYLFVCDLIERNKASSISLVEFLRNLKSSFSNHAAQEGLTPAQFMQSLEAAYEPAEPSEVASVTQGFASVSQYLANQIEDLDQLTRDGVYEDKYASFGLAADSGRHWYNFHPASYLECGLAGSFGGWEPEDDSGRDFVPGKVMAIDESGKLVPVDPKDVERPKFEMEVIPWEDIEEFLWCGANYE